jgi:phage shock protein A
MTKKELEQIRERAEAEDSYEHYYERGRADIVYLLGQVDQLKKKNQELEDEIAKLRRKIDYDKGSYF